MNQVELLTEVVKILKERIIEDVKYFSQVEYLSKEEWSELILTLLDKEEEEFISKMYELKIQKHGIEKKEIIEIRKKLLREVDRITAKMVYEDRRIKKRKMECRHGQEIDQKIVDLNTLEPCQEK